MKKVIFFSFLAFAFGSCNDTAKTTAEVTETIGKTAGYIMAPIVTSGVEIYRDYATTEEEKEYVEMHKEYFLNKKLYNIDKSIALSGTQKYSELNLTLDTLNGLSCILVSEFEKSGYKLPDTYKDILESKKFKKTENKVSYLIKVPAISSYTDIMNYLKAEYGEVFYYDYVVDQNTGEAIAYIYSNTKDPNYIVSGTKLKFEAYKIKHEYEGKTREENKTIK